MAVHGSLSNSDQVWTDTEVEARREAVRMSKDSGFARIVWSHCPEWDDLPDDQKKWVFFVETGNISGMIRTWESEIACYEKGREA